MNPEAQAVLEEILKKEPESLSFDDRAFLRARRSYLKKAQLEEYKDILEMDEKQPEVKASYGDLLKLARELGYNGKRAKRGQLEEFIARKNNNPFN